MENRRNTHNNHVSNSVDMQILCKVIPLVRLLPLSPVPLGIRRSGKALEKFEWFITGDSATSWRSLGGTFWGSQTFTIGTVGRNASFKVRCVIVKIFRSGSPGDLIYGIRAVDADGKPTGDDLCSGTIDGNDLSTSPSWVKLAMSSSAILRANTKYALVMRAPDGSGLNYVGWRTNVSTPTYTGGSAVYSDNSGSSWTIMAYDLMFEIWGK